MGYEYKIIFHEPDWLSKNIDQVKEKIRVLPTFVKLSDGVFSLLGKERRREEDRWGYDVRLFMDNEKEIFVEISARTVSIEEDLSMLMKWLEADTKIGLVDV